MIVTVRCFSHLRHHFGRAALQLELPEGSSSADLEVRVREMLPGAIASVVFRVAVNQRFVDAPVALADGDEVALMPPMQGG